MGYEKSITIFLRDQRLAIKSRGYDKGILSEWEKDGPRE